MIVAEKKKKQGRNDPCACGSGKKYKKCCNGIIRVPESQHMRISSLIQEALEYHKAGDLEAAEKIYHHVLSLEKNNADALHLLGEIAYQRKDYERAVDLIQQAIDINQTSSVVYRNLGNALRETGKHEAALNAFNYAIDLKPDYLSAYENLADTIKRSNRLDERSLIYLMKGFAQKGIRPESKYGILVMLGYVIESSCEWNETIFEECILPATEDALDRGDHLFAYYLNALTAVSYAQQPHTSEQWRECHALTNPMYILAGEKLSENLEDLVLPDVSRELPVLGFIIDLSIGSGSGAVLLINLLKGFSKLSPLPFQVIVYALDTVSIEMQNTCAKIGVKIVNLSTLRGKLSLETDLSQRLLTLRAEIQNDKVSALVYPGTYEAFPCMAASMGLAPVQIYLSLGFRSIFVPKIGGYVTTGSPVKSKKEFEGRWWRTAPIPHADIYSETGNPEADVCDEEVCQIREKNFSRYSVILGTLARPQKIENPLFIKALARLLRANSKAIFLWFGPKELSGVREMMEAEGISDRCLFQGWVDIKIYAKLIDIHMDSFPFPTALAMYDSMSAGTAGVWMEEDSDIGVGSNVMPLLRSELGTKEEQIEAQEMYRHPETGKCLALCARSTDEYIKYVQRLIDDIPFRNALGDAGRRFMKRFCHDPRIAAKAYAAHFLEIIDCESKR